MNAIWPQYLTIALYAFNLIIAIGMDGKPRTGKYSAGVTVASTLISAFVMWRGGWWASLGWPP